MECILQRTLASAAGRKHTSTLYVRKRMRFRACFVCVCCDRIRASWPQSPYPSSLSSVTATSFSAGPALLSQPAAASVQPLALLPGAFASEHCTHCSVFNDISSCDRSGSSSSTSKLRLAVVSLSLSNCLFAPFVAERSV